MESLDANAPEMKPDFIHIFTTFAMQAMIAMGRMENPVSGESKVDMKMARYFVEVLGVLTEKSEGNLTKEEEQHVEATIHQVKLAFVEASGAA